MKIKISFFKVWGKWSHDAEIEWPADPDHYTGWKDFRELMAGKEQAAVCMESPMGYPIMHVPTALAEEMARGPQGGLPDPSERIVESVSDWVRGGADHHTMVRRVRHMIGRS